MSIPLKSATDHAHKIMKLVTHLVKGWRYVGEIRRGEEEISRIDIVMNISERRAIKLKSILGCAGRTLEESDNLIIVRSKFEVLVYLHLVTKLNFPFQALFKTGPKPFLKAVINFAHSKGFYISEEGIVIDDQSVLGLEDEGAIFFFLGIEYLKPEQRSAITNMEQLT